MLLNNTFENFAIIEKDIFLAPNLSLEAKALYGYLASTQTQNGEISLETIAIHNQITPQKAEILLNELVENEAIEAIYADEGEDAFQEKEKEKKEKRSKKEKKEKEKEKKKISIIINNNTYPKRKEKEREEKEKVPLKEKETSVVSIPKGIPSLPAKEKENSESLKTCGRECARCSQTNHEAVKQVRASEVEIVTEVECDNASNFNQNGVKNQEFFQIDINTCQNNKMDLKAISANDSLMEFQKLVSSGRDFKSICETMAISLQGKTSAEKTALKSAMKYIASLLALSGISGYELTELASKREQQMQDSFEFLWKIELRQENKKFAYKAYVKFLKANPRLNFKDVFTAYARYRKAYSQKYGMNDLKFVMSFSNFLNRGTIFDYLDDKQNVTKSNPSDNQEFRNETKLKLYEVAKNFGLRAKNNPEIVKDANELLNLKAQCISIIVDCCEKYNCDINLYYGLYDANKYANATPQVKKFIDSYLRPTYNDWLIKLFDLPAIYDL